MTVKQQQFESNQQINLPLSLSLYVKDEYLKHFVLKYCCNSVNIIYR